MFNYLNSPYENYMAEIKKKIHNFSVIDYITLNSCNLSLA